MNATLPDRRLNAYRADLAAEYLRGTVEAPRYAEGERRQVIAGSAPVRRESRFDSALETEVLCGETLVVFEENEGWAWAQAEGDSYVGYLPAEALTDRIVTPTHRLTALRGFVFPAPDIKTPPLRMLSLNALLCVEDETDGRRFLRLADGGFIPSVHVAAADHAEPDFVAVAERFLGTPYLWGGRTSTGLDCSALIQLSLTAAGAECPRDTDMQEASIGEPLPDARDLGALRRGDLVFWKGHMGVMLDKERLLHCNAFHMETVIEPVAEAVARIAAAEGQVTSVRRMGKGGSA